MGNDSNDHSKEKRLYFLQHLVREFSDHFAIDLEQELLAVEGRIKELNSSIEHKLFQARATGNLSYYHGMDLLKKVCAKYGIPFFIESTNGRKGGEYGLAKTRNFVVAYSNNPEIAQTRAVYQKYYSSLNAELTLQGVLDFGELAEDDSVFTDDEDKFFVTVGIKRKSQNDASLVFNVPNADGFKHYVFFLEEIIEVYNSMNKKGSSFRLDEKESEVALKQKLKTNFE